MDFGEDRPLACRPGINRSLSRRHVIRLGAAASLALAMAPRAVLAREATPRTLAFNNLHTGETLKTVFWADGGYVRESLGEINRVLRDFRTGDVSPIDPELLDVLYTLRERLETNMPFEVISGYRSPATNAMLNARSDGVAKKSFHTRGMAIDIRLEDRKLSDLRGAALALGAGGVGYYPRSGFVHVDTGPVRRWG